MKERVYDRNGDSNFDREFIGLERVCDRVVMFAERFDLRGISNDERADIPLGNAMRNDVLRLRTASD